MSRLPSTAFAILLAVAFAAPVPAVSARDTDPFPKAERPAVAEIRRLADERRFAEADSLARGLIARAEAGKGSRARMLPDALDLRAEVLLRWEIAIGRNRADLPTVAQRALEVREATGAVGAAGLPASLQMLGIARLRRVEHGVAESLFTRAIASLESAAARDERAILVAMVWQAESQRLAKRLKRAEQTASRVVAALESASPADTATLVLAQITLGNALAEMSQTGRAIGALERALALEESRARCDSARLAAICRDIGRAHSVTGDLRRAERSLNRAAAIQERALGPEHTELAMTLFQLTFVHSEAGDYTAGLRVAERLVRVRERVFGPEHSQVAIALWQVSSALGDLGDYEGGLAAIERSVRIVRNLTPPRPDLLAQSLRGLCITRIGRGEGRLAREALQEAIAIKTRLYGAEGGRDLWDDLQLATALILEGKPLEAEAALDSLIPKAAGRLEVELPMVLRSHGVAACAGGNLDKAQASFDRSFAIHDSTLGPASPRTLASLSMRAAARWARGRREDAFADAVRYEVSALDFIRSTARALGEPEALSYQRKRGSGRDIVLTLAADATGLSSADRVEVLDIVVRSRLAVLDELADEARALPRHDPAMAPLVREVEEARAALAESMVRAHRRSRPPDSTVAAARARRDAAERALAERSDSFRSIGRRATAGAGEVMAALPPASALVSFVRYFSPRRLLLVGPAVGKSRAESGRYAALVYRAGGSAPAVVPLGEASELEPIVEGWVAALSSPPPGNPATANAARRRCDAGGRSLRARLWDPLSAHLAGAERVFVVPDGVLHRVNFAALPDAKGRYLVESDPLLHLLTAERDLVPWEGRAPGAGLLALGGADFDRTGRTPATDLIANAMPPAFGVVRVRSSVPDSLRVRFEGLPQTAAEVTEIGGLWREAGGGESMELTGAAATEAAFKRLAPGRRVIHLATHGFALGTRSPATPDGMRGIGGVGTGGAPVAEHTAPLLPGLALAGANVIAPEDEEDGFLTDEEITAVDLSSVDWAVLSSCESGRSDPGAIEAVQGLHRSFRRAGARAVVVSLWPVDDASTRSWMRHLYTSHLRGKSDTATAVRAASRALLAERRAARLDLHPFHWAAFVAAGDWR